MKDPVGNKLKQIRFFKKSIGIKYITKTMKHPARYFVMKWNFIKEESILSITTILHKTNTKMLYMALILIQEIHPCYNNEFVYLYGL